MNKYMVTLGDISGRWTGGPLTHVYVFEANDDEAAMNVIVSYLNGGNDWEVQFLGRITSGLQIQKVQVLEKVQTNIPKLSHKYWQEIGFSHLLTGELMVSQLQLFDPQDREKRLEAIKTREEKDKLDRVICSNDPPLL